jgi:putative transposase
VARLPRIEIAGAIYHVTARGNERKAVYRDATDRVRFLEIVDRTRGRYSLEILAYCLMGNHYHVLLRTLRPNLARAIRQLNGVYAQWFNGRHRRVGHLFQGRYKAVLVEDDAHLVSALAYIVRNPVRAQLCSSPAEWRWSSHRATVGLSPPGFLALSTVYAHLGPDRAAARRAYAKLVENGDREESMLHPLVYGSHAYVAEHLALISPSSEHPRRAVQPLPPPLASLLSRSSGLPAIQTAYDYGYTLRQIATILDVHPSTISRRLNATNKT